MHHHSALLIHYWVLCVYRTLLQSSMIQLIDRKTC